MTTAQAIAKFDVLIDKYGGDYLTTDEKLSFLNMAQYEFLNRLVPDSLGGIVNYDMDANTLETISPLVISTSLTPSSGAILYSALETSLRSVSGDSTCTVFGVVALSYSLEGNVVPIKYTKLNNLNAYRANSFKEPSTSSPLFYIAVTASGKSLVILPTITSAVSILALKTPKTLTADNSPDFSDYALNQIIAIAVKLAGVSTRDEELIGTMNGSNVQSIG